MLATMVTVMTETGARRLAQLNMGSNVSEATRHPRVTVPKYVETEFSLSRSAMMEIQ